MTMLEEVECFLCRRKVLSSNARHPISKNEEMEEWMCTDADSCNKEMTRLYVPKVRCFRQ